MDGVTIASSPYAPAGASLRILLFLFPEGDTIQKEEEEGEEGDKITVDDMLEMAATYEVNPAWWGSFSYPGPLRVYLTMAQYKACSGAQPTAGPAPGGCIGMVLGGERESIEGEGRGRG